MMRASIAVVLMLSFVLMTSASGGGDCSFINRAEWEEASKLLPNMTCFECELAVEAARVVVHLNKTQVDVEKVLIAFCEFAKIEDRYVCVKIVSEYKEFFMYLFINEALSTHLVCGILDYCEKPKYPTWNVTLSPQPPIKPYPSPPPPTEPRLYMLHFSDVHVDPLYTPGLNSKCGEPLCCRPPNGNGTDANNTAGIWGDYQCDPPGRLFENMLEWISHNLPNLDFAIFTGDMPPHNVWDVTKEEALASDAWMLNTYKQYLPKLKLFPAVGNHEAVPVDQFAPRDIKGKDWDMDWLYHPLAELWGHWLPWEAKEQAKYAGYYTTTTPGDVRIVSLNTNVGCDPDNWWLKIPSSESADPDNQLEWLVKVLESAERKKEIVYLIMHIEMDETECGKNWWTNFHKIAYRYQNTILGTFAGHTHEDRFRVIYADPVNSTTDYVPFLNTFLAGGVTPYQHNNPGFRVYELDPKTKAVLDYKQYYVDLTELNANGVADWKVLYTALGNYNLTNMSPSEWHRLSSRMATDNTLLDQYLLYKNKGHQVHCDKACAQFEWCSQFISPPGAGLICSK